MKKYFVMSLIAVSIAVIFIYFKPEIKEPEKVEAKGPGMIETRQKFFGAEHVDPATGEIDKDMVILSWVGVSNFAAAINGHVILLDSWIPGGDESDYVPATVGELIALDPKAIFIGHAHFDHVDHAAPILEQTGAVLVGTPGHCQAVKEKAEREEKIDCLYAAGEEAQPGEMFQLNFLDGVSIRALAHIHSAAKVPDLADPSRGIFPEKELTGKAPKGNLAKLIGAVGEDGGGTMMYQFQVGDFTLAWNDSAGPLKEEAPELLDSMASLPQTDVQAGAIMGFNQYTNGLRDPRMYIEALQPQVFIPTHHDNWAPPITTRGGQYKGYLQKELELLAEKERPELLFISDPHDYVNPLTFDIHDARWR